MNGMDERLLWRNGVEPTECPPSGTPIVYCDGDNQIRRATVSRPSPTASHRVVVKLTGGEAIDVAPLNLIRVAKTEPTRRTDALRAIARLREHCADYGYGVTVTEYSGPTIAATMGGGPVVTIVIEVRVEEPDGAVRE